MSLKEIELKELGRNIRISRKNIGISQIKLADMIGISQTHMSNIESGNTGISLSMAFKLSQVLQCSIDELVCGLNKNESTNNNLPLGACSLGDFMGAMKLCIKQIIKETQEDTSNNKVDEREKSDNQDSVQ